MNSLSVVDYVVFALVLLSSMLIGIYHAWRSRKVSNTGKIAKEQYVRRETMGIIPVSLSLVATVISPNAVLGVPSEIFSHSVQYFIGYIGSILGVVICYFVFLPMFFELQLTSINKYLSRRFNFPALRIVSSISFNIFNTFISGIYVYGPALAISSVTPLSLNASIIAVGLVCAFYTAAGGFKAVVWADVFQFFVMLSGMIMVAVQGTISANGWNNVWQISSDENLIQWKNIDYDTFSAVPTVWECVLGLMIVRAAFFATNQMCVQRYCTLPSLLHAKLSLCIGIILMSVFMSLSTYCGVVLFANYYNCDPLLRKQIDSPDQLMPFFVVNNLDFLPGLAGLFIAAVFSGSLSTLSSAINSMSVLTWDDFLKRYLRVSARTEYILLKVIALAYGLAVTFVAFLAKRMGSVLEVVLLLCGGLSGPQFGMFFLGAVVPFVDGKSAMLSFVLGQVVSMAFNVTLMIYPRPKRRLPTSLDGCSNGTTTAHHERYFNLTNVTATEDVLGHISGSSDILWIHNISPFFMPFVGCLTTILSGILLAVLTGGFKRIFTDTQYLSPVIHGFFRNYNTGDHEEESLRRKLEENDTTFDKLESEDIEQEQNTKL